MCEIRPATTKDAQGIQEVIVEAFTHSEFGYGGEAEIVDQLSENCAELLSLVAVESEDVLGHVLFSPVTIETELGTTHGMGLAPLAVTPGRQKCGIGTALVEAGREQLATQACPFVVVLGHPVFYSRCGFRPASSLGITHGFDGIPQGVFSREPARPAGVSNNIRRSSQLSGGVRATVLRQRLMRLH